MADASDENPYSSSNETGTSPRYRVVLSWTLVILAILFVIISLPTAWYGLELLNQEYLHLWRVEQIAYDIEINGTPVSIDDAIRSSLFNVAAHWTIAISLTLAAWVVSRRRRQGSSWNTSTAPD